MPFWFKNLLIQRQFPVFFLWRLRILVQGDITWSYPGIFPQSSNVPIFLPTVLPTSGTNYCQIPLLPKPKTALRTILTTNVQKKNGSITGKHLNQQHQTTSQCVFIQLCVMCYQLWGFYEEKSLYCSKLQFKVKELFKKQSFLKNEKQSPLVFSDKICQWILLGCENYQIALLLYYPTFCKVEHYLCFESFSLSKNDFYM